MQNKIIDFYCHLMAENRNFHDQIKHSLCKKFNITLNDIDNRIDDFQDQIN